MNDQPYHWIATGHITNMAREELAEAGAIMEDQRVPPLILVGIPGPVDILNDGTMTCETTVNSFVWHVPGNRNMQAWCVSATQTEIQTYYESLPVHTTQPF